MPVHATSQGPNTSRTDTVAKNNPYRAFSLPGADHTSMRESAAPIRRTNETAAPGAHFHQTQHEEDGENWRPQGTYRPRRPRRRLSMARDGPMSTNVRYSSPRPPRRSESTTANDVPIRRPDTATFRSSRDRTQSAQPTLRSRRIPSPLPPKPAPPNLAIYESSGRIDRWLTEHRPGLRTLSVMQPPLEKARVDTSVPEMRDQIERPSICPETTPKRRPTTEPPPASQAFDMEDGITTGPYDPTNWKRLA